MARVRIAVDEQGESLHLDTRIQHRGPLTSLTHPLTPLRAACTWARGAFWSRRVELRRSPGASPTLAPLRTRRTPESARSAGGCSQSASALVLPQQSFQP